MTSSSAHAPASRGPRVSLWAIAAVAVSLTVGLAAGLSIRNLLSAEEIHFSTAGIVSFVFTVALGGSAIILAVITIVLSRGAEDALIRRSDEGIRLQNDVFVRTNEVLSRIQASTGVTEKRIEDIIAGRTSVIAAEVVEKSLPAESGVSKQFIEKISKALADSLKSELVPLLSATSSGAMERLEQMEAKQNRAHMIAQEWREYRQSVVDELRARSGVTIQFECEGNTGADSPEEFWDIVLDVSGKRVVLDIHTKSQFLEKGGSYHLLFVQSAYREQFAKNICWRAWMDKVDFVLFVFDQELWSNPKMDELLKVMQQFNERAEKELFVPVSGCAKEIADKVLSLANGSSGQREE